MTKKNNKNTVKVISVAAVSVALFTGVIIGSVGELDLFAAKESNQLKNAEYTVETGAAVYIGEEKALEAALVHAGLNRDTVTKIKTKLDLEYGKMTYEVEFYHDKTEYEYDIDALTGEIIKAEKDDSKNKDEKTAKPTVEETKLIGEEKAKEAAIAHAGVNTVAVEFKNIKLDVDDGIAVYEIKFISEQTKYEYDINAYTGEIVDVDADPVKQEKNKENNSNNDNKNDKNTGKEDKKPVADESKLIGEEKAKSIALAHAGVAVAAGRFENVELEKERGTALYEIEFTAGGLEYEYDIDAYTGDILKSEIEKDD